ncbi:hypothetical protein LS48_02760 [Aequorivita aquimaris]|uniref:Uncharacterized protein n=1 Tax=Aequorivita aquimaris TaxID=1548749 RepID=A0A137RMH5_9FLAO|nr:hypothetical protein [Aequorivita aquimaris]KXO01390.1 hypothetical protein LS48_02760 [Aequorivita aquimaris]
MKKLIILISILITNFAYGQRGDSHNFNFKVKFDKSIPVENLQIFYIEYNANRITSIKYETNEENEIIFNGINYSIAGAGTYFPTIIFSLKEDKILNGSNEKIETYRMFYLISETETYLEDIGKEIFFTNSSKPYFIKVGFEWQNSKKIYNVEQVPLNQLSTEILEVITSNNTWMKIKR